MAGIKVRRTLDDRGFKKYMKFCESLKDGSNDALIDTFKYRFAVMEGRIVPKGAKRKKPLTEAAGIRLGEFEKAFQGLVGAFLPHMDEEEQNFLGCVCQVLDEKVNGGDMDGAMDALKNAVRDAGGDPDAYDDDECPECEDDECPEGTCKVDGECVPCKDDKKPNSDDADEECCCGKKKKMTEAVYPDNPMTECGEQESLVEDLDWLKKHNAKENKAHSTMPNYNTFADDHPVYGDFYDDPDNRYQDRDILPDDDGFDELDFDHEAAVPPAAYDDEAREPIADYDAMADDLLRDAGYGDLASDSVGVREENRRFYGR